GVEELDLEGMVRDWPGLPNELVQPGFLNHPLSIGIHIGAVVSARGGTVDLDAKANGSTGHGGAHHKMHIARVEAVDGAAGRPVERGGVAAGRPCPAQAPALAPGRGCGAIARATVPCGPR